MQTILVIDDEAGIRGAVKDILEDEKYRVLTAEDGIVGLSLLENERVDLVFLDVWLPRMGGMDVLKEIRSKHSSIEVIIVSGHATIELAVQSVKLGAFDFIEKPLSIDRIVTSARNALTVANLKKENIRLKSKESQNQAFLGKAPAFLSILEIIGQSAQSDARVLITGENGSGKELAAHEIHKQSARAEGPFIEVNCAAIPDTLIESELFGHEKGSFTDAVARRKGKFEMAHKGTLFLDEVADLSLSAQAKVLRAIQELKFERLGSETSLTVDVRIICATNKDLQEEIKAGRFREDLYFRINVIPIRMPALRERKEDIPLLANFFLQQFANAGTQACKKLSKDAEAIFMEHRWKGNIRELKNIIERISVMSDETVVSSETALHFLSKNQDLSSLGKAFAEHTDKDQISDKIESEKHLEPYKDLKLQDAKDLFEKQLLVSRLKENGNNITRTAEQLGLYASNLHAKLKKYGIQVEK